MNLSGEPTKSGLRTYAEMLELAGEIVASLPNLRLTGLMTLPDPAFDERQTRQTYALLRDSLAKASAELNRRETFKELSMGMSNDYRLAIEEGATMVRLGSSIFGSR